MKIKWLRFIFPLLFVTFFLHASETVLPQKAEASQEATSVVKPKASEPQPVEAKLLTDEKAIQGGKPFWIGVELKMAEGWDTYWINPGDAGFPTKVVWHLPEGFDIGPIHWPIPERFVSQSLVGFGYTHSVILMAEVTPPKDFSEKATIHADVSWLACKEQCVPGSAHVELTLPAGDSAKDPSLAAQFDQAKLKWPKELPGSLTADTKEKEIVLNFKPSPGDFKEIVEAVFIPEVGEMIDYLAPQQLHKEDGGKYTLNVKRAHPEETPPSHVKGVLVIAEKGDSAKKGIQVDTPILKAASSSSKHLSFPVALVFAFLGGLILNVMPCVLPVIAIKIFGFVKIAGQRRGTILKHGGAFALGVLVSFWILSILLLMLRAFGHGLGWGFQLQEPLFVVVLTIILFLLALSLFGVFEVGTSLISLGDASKSVSSPLGSSFMSGILATLVATPCTGPLLGPALGFAMTLPIFSSLLVFTMMGLGMASPYLLFSAFPKLIRYLPKPGNWMIAFKQLMGFLMMATCLWLIWVFGAQTSEIAVFLVMGCLLVIAVGSWIYGHFGSLHRKKMTRKVATLVAALIVLTGSFGAISVAGKHQGGTTNLVHQVSDSGWESYSPERVAQLRKEGKPVFIDFTAKWCLICQANKVTLHSSEVEKAFEEKGVVTMMADWTKRDATITEALHDLGRSGVPVYVLYSGNPKDEPLILPQTLTASIVKNYLEKL